MSDPIERMNHLRQDVEGGPMLPAAEVRRRGDRLRRRRTVAMTAGAALAVVAIVAPVAFLTGADPSGDPPVDPAQSPSTTAPSSVAALSEANLLRDEDVTSAWSVGIDVAVGDTTDGDTAVNPCSEGLADLGARQVLTRTFGFSALEGGDGDADHHASETIASFPDPSAAQRAYGRVKTWIEECAPDGAQRYTAGTWTDVAIPVTGEAALGGASYGPAEAEPGSQYDVAGRDDLGWILTSGVVVSGNRIAVLTDLNLLSGAGGDTGAPVRSLLPIAAERLVLETDPSSTASRMDIPFDFPIDRDLSAPEGEEVEGPRSGMNAITEVVIDGAEVFPGATVDRLAASATGPEYLDGRELHTYRSDSEAAQVLQRMRDALRRSPESEGVIWTVHAVDGPGEESLTLSRTLDLGLGTDVFQFTRVGNAILAIDLGGEWSLDTVPAGVAQITDLSSAIAPEMCIFAADGC